MENKVKVILSAEDRSKLAFSSLKKSLEAMKGDALSLRGVFSGLLPALTVGGLAAFAKSGIDAADALKDMSDRLGVSVSDLASFKLAADQSGTSLEDVGKGIGILTRSIGEAEAGNKAMAKSLADLGVTSRDPKEAFLQLADATQRIQDPAKRAALLSDVLKKSYLDLVPILSQGSEGLRASALASASFAESMAKLAPDADKFNDQMALLKSNAAGAAGALLLELVPALNEIFNRISLVRKLIGAGGIFGTIGVTAFTDDTADVMKRLRDGIKATQEAITTEKGKGKDASPFEEKLRGLNAQLAVMKENSRAAALALGEQFKNYKVPQQPGTPGVIEAPADAAAAKAAAAAAKAASKAAAAAAKADASKAAAAAAATAEAELALRATTIEQAARLEQDDIGRQITGNKVAFEAKLIDAADYYAALTVLQRQQADSEIAALAAQRTAAEAVKGSDADKVKAKAEIVRIDTEIELIERRTADQAVSNAATKQGLAAALKLKQDEFLDALEQEAFLSDLSNDARETALLLLDAEKLGITDINRLLELQGKIRQDNADKDAAKEAQRQQDALYDSVQQGVQKAFADGLNAIGTEGGFQGAIKGLADTIKNAMGNALAGSLTDSFLGLLGGKEGVLGIAGSLGLGGKRDGSSVGSAIFVTDVAKGGALGAAAGATGTGGGIFDGIMSMFSGLLDGLKTGLSDLVGGIGNFVAGLFSSGGGGGGGGSSNVSGWVSAIASLFGYAEGGFTGPGSKFQPAGVVHAGEYVFSADSVRRLGLGALDNLHRVAKGSMIPRGARMGYAEGGLVNLPGSVAPTVNASTKIVNAFDMDTAFAEYLNTRGGERAILNVMQRNPRAA